MRYPEWWFHFLAWGALAWILLAGPDAESRKLGWLFLVGVGWCVAIGLIRVKRRYWPAKRMTQGPEYADLQAAMARFHETEDKAHRRRDSNV